MKTHLLLIPLLLVAASAAADARRGKQLHDGHCMKCHDTGVYSRSNRFVRSPDALRAQVGRCSLNAGAKWSDAEIRDVVDYLDQAFYHFDSGQAAP